MTDSAKPGGASIAYEWWRSLNPTDSLQSGRQRAALAGIRRATTPIEVMQEPEALRLIARMPRNPDRVATLAGILAFVRESDDRRVARAIGRTTMDDDQSAPPVRKPFSATSSGESRRAHGTNAPARPNGQGDAERPRPLVRHPLLGRRGEEALDIRLLRSRRQHAFRPRRIADRRIDAIRTIGNQEWPTFFSFTFSRHMARPI